MFCSNLIILLCLGLAITDASPGCELFQNLPIMCPWEIEEPAIVMVGKSKPYEYDDVGRIRRRAEPDLGYGDDDDDSLKTTIWERLDEKEFTEDELFPYLKDRRDEEARLIKERKYDMIKDFAFKSEEQLNREIDASIERKSSNRSPLSPFFIENDEEENRVKNITEESGKLYEVNREKAEVDDQEAEIEGKEESGGINDDN